MLLNRFKKVYTRRKFWKKNRIGFMPKRQGVPEVTRCYMNSFDRISQIGGRQIKIWPVEAGGGAVATQ